CRIAVSCCRAAAKRSRRRLRTSNTAGMEGLQLGDLLLHFRDFFAVVSPAVGVAAAQEVADGLPVAGHVLLPLGYHPDFGVGLGPLDGLTKLTKLAATLLDPAFHPFAEILV